MKLLYFTPINEVHLFIKFKNLYKTESHTCIKIGIDKGYVKISGFYNKNEQKHT